MDILMVDVYKFCVEVFEKTLGRTKMIDYSFEKKFYGAYYTLCKKCCARVQSHETRAQSFKMGLSL